MLSVLTLALVFSALLISANAGGQASADVLPTVTIGNATTLRGKAFDVDITIQDLGTKASNGGLSSLVLEVRYDVSVMSFDSHKMKKTVDENEIKSVFPGEPTFTNLEGPSGKKVQPLRIVFNAQDNFYNTNGNDFLIRLHFTTVKDNAVELKTYPLILTCDLDNTFRNDTSYVWSDEWFMMVPSGTPQKKAVNTQNGSVEITEGAYQCYYRDWDGRLIQGSEENDLEAFAVDDPADPERDPDRKYTYTFKDWSCEFVNNSTAGVNWGKVATVLRIADILKVVKGLDDAALSVLAPETRTQLANASTLEEETLESMDWDGIVAALGIAGELSEIDENNLNADKVMAMWSICSAIQKTAIISQFSSFKFELTATYNRTAQDYTVQYHFGQMNITSGNIVYGTLAGSQNFDTVQDSFYYGAQLTPPNVITKDYYSYFAWYLDEGCTVLCDNYTVLEDTYKNANNEYINDLDHLTMHLYGYRRVNAAGSNQGNINYDETLKSEITNVVELNGYDVTVYSYLTKNTGIRDMLLKMVYEREVMDFVGFEWGTAFSSDTNRDASATLATYPYTFSWEYIGTDDEGKDANCYDSRTYNGKDLLLTLHFTLHTVDGLLDPAIADGEYAFSYVYESQKNIIKIIPSESDAVSSYWYASVNVVEDAVEVRGVTAPGANNDYTFNNTVQTYAFADESTTGTADYDIVFNSAPVTSMTRKDQGTDNFALSLKTDDKVSRYWTGSSARVVADVPYVFTVKPKAITAPTYEEDEFVYDGNAHAFVISVAGTTGYYTFKEGSATSGLNAGNYTATVQLAYPEKGNTYWAGAAEAKKYDDITYTFTVYKRRVTAPTAYTAEEKSYTFEANAFGAVTQTYVFKTLGGNSYYSIKNDSNKRAHAGSQQVVCGLNDAANNCWDEEGDPIADKTFPFTIQEKAVTRPTASTQTYVYTGNTITYTFSALGDESFYYTYSGDKEINAGEYTVTASLKKFTAAGEESYDAYDVYWADVAVADKYSNKTYDFIIEKATVVAPTAHDDAAAPYVFDKDKTHTYTFKAEDDASRTLYNVPSAEDRTKKNFGTYDVTVSLKDAANYRWSHISGEGESAALVYKFNIAKRAVTIPVKTDKTYTYSKFLQTFEFEEVSIVDLNSYFAFSVERTDEGELGGVSGRNFVNAGAYRVTAALVYGDDTYWAGKDSNADQTYDFTVNVLLLAFPADTPTGIKTLRNWTYDGNQKTFDLWSNVAALTKLHSTVLDNQATDAGEYAAKLHLNDSVNTKWNDSTIADKEYAFTIDKASVPKPTMQKTYAEFCNAEIEFPVNVQAAYKDHYVITGTKAFHVGEYTDRVQVSLKNTDNYKWDDAEGGSAPIYFSYQITPHRVSKPVAKYGFEPLYTGEEFTYVFDSIDSDYCEAIDGNKGTNVGLYSVTVALKKFNAPGEEDYDKYDTLWDIGSTTDPITGEYTWKIVPITLTPAIDSAKFDGAKHKPTISNVDAKYYGTPDYQEGYDDGWTTAGTYTVTLTMDDEYYGNYVWAKPSKTDAQQTELRYSISTRQIEFESVSIQGWTYTKGVSKAQPCYVLRDKETLEVLARTYIDGSGNYIDASNPTYPVIVEYKLKSGGSRTTEKPILAGKYFVYFSVEGTASYNGLGNDFESLTIDKLNIDMSQAKWDYTEPFTYDGEEHTVSVVDYNPNGVTPSYTLTTSATNVNTYTAHVNFEYDTVNCEITLNQTFKYDLTWEILPKEVDIDWHYASSYTFTGEAFAEPTATYTDVTGNLVDLSASMQSFEGDYEYGEAEVKKFLHAGRYVYSCFEPSGNYKMSESASKEMEVSIAKLQIAVPDAHVGTYTFKESAPGVAVEQTYTFASAVNSAYVAVSGNKKTYVSDAGSVTAALVYPADTYWSVTEEVYDIADKTYTFEILPYVVEEPTAHVGTYTFKADANGKVMQTYTFGSKGDSARYNVSGTTSSDSVISTTITVTLKDTTNYIWDDTKDTEAKTFSFVILRRAIDLPMAHVGSFTFKEDEQGKPLEQTYTFANESELDYDYIGVTGTKKRLVKDTTPVVASLLYENDTYWVDDSVSAAPAEDEEETFWTEEQEYPFIILPLAVIAPTAHDYKALPYTFAADENGAIAQTYTFKSEDEDSKKYYAVLDEVAFPLTKNVSGTTTVKVSLNDKDNYIWFDTEDNVDILYPFTVAKCSVVAPYGTGSYVYTGENIDFTLVENDASKLYYSYPSDSLKGKAAASYNVEIALLYPNDTYWGTVVTDNANKTVTFTIAKATVVAPTASVDTYVYTGKPITYKFASEGDKTLYTVESDLSMTDVDNRIITVSLSDPANYRWAHLTGAKESLSLTFTFTISKATVVFPVPEITVYKCAGQEQIFAVPENKGIYTVVGNKGEAVGEHIATVTLDSPNNYRWADVTGENESASRNITFTIEHDFTERVPIKENLKAPADCDNAATYYFVCRCGVSSKDFGGASYSDGSKLGHIYNVTFVWDETNFTAKAQVVCERAHELDENDTSHDKVIDADVVHTYIAPGIADGKNIYTATITLENVYNIYSETVEETKVYTDVLVKKIDAIGYTYGDPVWTWTKTSAGYEATATFTCLDPGYEYLVKEAKSDPKLTRINDEGETKYSYTVYATFNGVLYSETSELLFKPTLDFDLKGGSSDLSTTIPTVYILPGTAVTFPTLPEKEDGSVFVKWLSEDGVSIFWKDGAYTEFVMPESDVVFVAVWKSIGALTVSVKDLAGDAYTDCKVYVRRGDGEPMEYDVDESGIAVIPGLDYGNYTIEVKSQGADGVLYTTSAVLSNAEVTVPVTFSTKRFNTELVNNGIDVSVDNLENTLTEDEKEAIVTTANDGDITEIKVTVNVKEAEEEVKENIQTLIEEDEEITDLTIVEFVDVTLSKSVKVIEDGAEKALEPEIIATAADYVEIVYAISDDLYETLAKVRGSVDNIVVARTSDAEEGVNCLIKTSESAAAASEQDCYFVREEEGVAVIVVRTKNFDNTSYALCVSGTPQALDNEITSFVVTNWTYGDAPIDATATATHGTPVVEYYYNNEWTTVTPVNAGSYPVRAYVVGNDAYKGANADEKTLTISPKVIDVSSAEFKDLTVTYDGEFHSIEVTGNYPTDKIGVVYENNSQIDVGEYTVTATFVGKTSNYVPSVAQLTATLTIEEDVQPYCWCWIFWVLLGIGIAELIILIVLIIAGSKGKKDDGDKTEAVACCISLCTLGKVAKIAILAGLAAVDVVLLVLIIVKAIKNKKNKDSAPADKAPAEETPAEEKGDEAQGE